MMESISDWNVNHEKRGVVQNFFLTSKSKWIKKYMYDRDKHHVCLNEYFWSKELHKFLGKGYTTVKKLKSRL